MEFDRPAEFVYRTGAGRNVNGPLKSGTLDLATLASSGQDEHTISMLERFSPDPRLINVRYKDPVKEFRAYSRFF